MNDNQRAQKEAARSLSIRNGEGLGSDLLAKNYFNQRANEHGDIAVDENVSKANRAQGMRAEMGGRL